MAVFIRKERLGSRPEPRSLTQRIESTTGFKALRNTYAEAKEKQVAELRDKYEGNAELQHRRSMTQEERSREAIDRMIPAFQDLERNRTGETITHEEGRKRAEKLAERHDKESGE